MGKRFEGKTVLLTGASAGIGAEAARLFASEGARIFLNARREGPLHDFALELRRSGASVRTFAGDVGNIDDCREVIEEAAQLGFDVLVNNAGAHFRGPFGSRSTEEIAAMVDVNLRGPLVLTRLALPHFKARGGGTFVHVASLAGKTPLPDAATYGATKFALRAFSIALREELRDTSIRSALVSPGPVDTGFLMENIDDVADVVFAQPMSDARTIAELVVTAAADGRRERAFPRGSSALATAAYLMPPLRRVLEPVMKLRGRQVKERYRRRRRP